MSILQYIRVFKVNQFKIFTDKYSQTLKTLNVSFWHMDREDPMTSIELISQFENLRQLSLALDQIRTTEPIDDCLSLIGQKCNKLLKLDLRINGLLQISKQFFDVFYHFEAIKELKIKLRHKKRFSGSVECFKHCKQLKHLEIDCPGLREDFFANIASFVPNLRFLRIRGRVQKINNDLQNYA